MYPVLLTQRGIPDNLDRAESQRIPQTAGELRAQRLTPLRGGGKLECLADTILKLLPKSQRSNGCDGAEFAQQRIQQVFAREVALASCFAFGDFGGNPLSSLSLPRGYGVTLGTGGSHGLPGGERHTQNEGDEDRRRRRESRLVPAHELLKLIDLARWTSGHRLVAQVPPNVHREPIGGVVP